MNLALAPFRGGKKLVVRGAAAAAAGLGVTLASGLAGDPRRALYGYLVAFVYWIGIALAALVLVGAFHAASARWPVVLRRFVESLPQSLPLFLVLFVPVVLGVKHLFPWTDLGKYSGHALEIMEHKRPYLNVPFFVGRAAFYFVFWIAVAHLLRAWSVRQDASGALELTRWQRRLGAGALPFLALTLSFAAFDWMMSVEPKFISTIFGVYWFAGSFMGAFAVTIVAAQATRGDPEQFGHHMNLDHFHSLGKFLLAFTAFWAYVAFSQGMLIYMANLPETAPWYVTRTRGGWGAIGVFLVVGHFVVPFFLLLSRQLKRTPKVLAGVALWLLFVHWVDVYWVIMPALLPDGPSFSLVDLAAFVGVGGAAVAFTVLRMRGATSVPVKDPYLAESLRYQPQ
jgi:hypothetical protein